ncbi:hypothetical protein U5801_25955 [Lamprobacter modestohalophilus]|uniref:hypothetical protein n=1 Tax=Lamprobacter modestohalophilus TaxID=1064514 RepID=UPI002ADEB077|nr:hypothetical protein [Lamprobacter modestohalophilus]MEA1053225.1 hypothetical protein [Lamprobacter modestohalophilus]
MIDPIQKPAYHWLLHPDSAHAVTNYRQQLAEQGLAQAGAYLREQLSDQAPDSLSEAAFLKHLINTKRPLIFAESVIYGDGRDWSPTELSLLGDLGVAVPVRIFDDGRHHRPAVLQARRYDSATLTSHSDTARRAEEGVHAHGNRDRRAA